MFTFLWFLENWLWESKNGNIRKKIDQIINNVVIKLKLGGFYTKIIFLKFSKWKTIGFTKKKRYKNTRRKKCKKYHFEKITPNLYFTLIFLRENWKKNMKPNVQFFIKTTTHVFCLYRANFIKIKTLNWS